MTPLGEARKCRSFAVFHALVACLAQIAGAKVAPRAPEGFARKLPGRGKCARG